MTDCPFIARPPGSVQTAINHCCRLTSDSVREHGSEQDETPFWTRYLTVGSRSPYLSLAFCSARMEVGIK